MSDGKPGPPNVGVEGGAIVIGLVLVKERKDTDGGFFACQNCMSLVMAECLPFSLDKPVLCQHACHLLLICLSKVRGPAFEQHWSRQEKGERGGEEEDEGK